MSVHSNIIIKSANIRYRMSKILRLNANLMGKCSNLIPQRLNVHFMKKFYGYLKTPRSNVVSHNRGPTIRKKIFFVIVIQ